MDTLPAPFADLAPFLEKWDRPDYNSRYRSRLASSYAELEHFHDVMLARGPEIVAYLDARPLDMFAEDDRRLARLLLALPPVAQAVELFRQVRVPDTERVSMTVTKEYRF